MHRQLLCGILTIALFCVIVAFADNDLLPRPGECGRMQTMQYFNLKKISEPDEFPWMAEVYYELPQTKEMNLICGAVLINPRYLITVSSAWRREASHVVLGNSATVCSDVTDHCSTKEYLEIEEIVIHPFFNRKNFHNNIALLRLKTTVTYTGYIRPICLPKMVAANNEYDGDHLMLTGFNQRTGTSTSLHKMFALIYNLQDCQRILENKLNVISPINITEKQLCGKACYNDMQFVSGSALMGYEPRDNETFDYYYLVGILSAGASCNSPVPDAFTRIDSYLNWIEENLY